MEYLPLHFIFQNSGYQNVTDNPCTAIGYSEAVDAAYLWEQPCGSTPDKTADGANATTFYLKGNMSK